MQGIKELKLLIISNIVFKQTSSLTNLGYVYLKLHFNHFMLYEITKHFCEYVTKCFYHFIPQILFTCTHVHAVILTDFKAETLSDSVLTS